ncbi:hypothetical protein CCP3SC15_10057 [Gammaproteobacteria bacterium]
MDVPEVLPDNGKIGQQVEFPEIDINAALARMMGDHELLKLLMGEFANSYGPLVEILPRLLANGDLATVFMKAHDLKGVA